MAKLSNPTVIKDLLIRYGFRFTKALGQNFLIDSSVCPKMAAACGADADTAVLEIGPGIGVLTRELASTAKQVLAVEIDERLKPVLKETLSDLMNVTVKYGDVMKLDLRALIREYFGDEQICVCANLPYYITSPLLMRLLESELPLRSITVMVQKEAAQRICAQPATRACGAVSITVRYYSEPEILFPVSRNSFMPPPGVDSAVIRLRLREQPAVQVADEKWFFQVTRGAFAQRRKTAVNSLSHSLKLEKSQLQSVMRSLGLNETARAEQLSMSQFAVLSNHLIAFRKGV